MDDSAPASLPPVRTTDGPQSIHPAIRKVWLATGFFTWFILMAPLVAAVGVPLLLGRFHAVPALRIALIVAIAAVPLALLAIMLGRIHAQWRNWRYEVREYDIVLQWGVFWRTNRSIPRDRVQHVDVNSGPLDRRFGLVQVQLYTAGSPGAVGTIPGLGERQAEDLKEMILESQARHV